MGMNKIFKKFIVRFFFKGVRDVFCPFYFIFLKAARHLFTQNLTTQWWQKNQNKDIYIEKEKFSAHFNQERPYKHLTTPRNQFINLKNFKKNPKTWNQSR